ncbi:MAG: FlgD immunoglobulin-like domain containing protein [bacterium]
MLGSSLGRRCGAVALGVLAAWTLGGRAQASSVPATTLEQVFPAGRSVCAGNPPRRAERPAADARSAAPLILDDCEPSWQPGDESRPFADVHILRWRSVEARPLSEEIPFEVASGTVGLMLRAAADTDDWDISVELLGPHGDLLSCGDCPDAPAASEIREGRGEAQMPSTDRPGWQLVPGRYAFRVRATPADSTIIGDGATTSVVATLRTSASVEVERRLDLNFVYLPDCSLTAQIAESSPRFAEYLQKVDQWLAPTGIRIGRVTHVDLNRPEFSIIATWDEAGEMFRTSCGVGRPRALNIYCLEGFEPPLNPVVGLAGAIPGPLANGTRDSGIAIRTQPFFTCSDCLDAFASLTAHEIGHYLGFFHTTEADLEHWDPFLDTPECHDIALNDCPDHDYVMFPLIHRANHIWSPDQLRVAWRHPMVRTVAVVGKRDATAPSERAILAASPNPFASEVRLAVPKAAAPASVAIYDVSGRLVRRLAGSPEEIVWDGRDGAEQPAPAGIYFARSVAADGRATLLRLVKVR